MKTILLKNNQAKEIDMKSLAEKRLKKINAILIKLEKEICKN